MSNESPGSKNESLTLSDESLNKKKDFQVSADESPGLSDESLTPSDDSQG